MSEEELESLEYNIDIATINAEKKGIKPKWLILDQYLMHNLKASTHYKIGGHIGNDLDKGRSYKGLQLAQALSYRGRTMEVL